MDGRLTVCQGRNPETPSALPTMSVRSEKEGDDILVSVGSRGYGPTEGQYTLSGFYDPSFSSEEMVNRLQEVRSWFVDLRNWMRAGGTRDTWPTKPTW